MLARLIGLLILAAGAAAGWYLGLGPLEAARAGAAEVQIHDKIFLIAPMAMLMGLFVMVGGEPVLESYRRPPRSRRDHLLVWPMFGLAVLAGLAGWWWIDQQLDAMGYVTTG